MKIALLLLVVLPLVYSAALSEVEKRMVIGNFHLEKYIPQIAGLLNNTYSHSGCEKACHNVLNAAGLLCDFLHVCTKVENYLHLPHGN